MSTVFVGGSRHISHLPAPITDRLKKMMDNQCHVVVGDANGADKAVQTFFADAGYKAITVFCSGAKPRNNVGAWKIHAVYPPRGTKGFQFYAAKDRQMALAADFGLMIWDGKSPGTVLNMLRLIRAGKIAVLVDVPSGKTHTLKAVDDWTAFLQACDEKFIEDLKTRATEGEWEPRVRLQSNLLTQTVVEEPVAALP